MKLVVRRKKMWPLLVLAPLSLSIITISSCKSKTNDNSIKEPIVNSIKSIKIDTNSQQKIEIKIIFDSNYLSYTPNKTQIKIERVSDNFQIDQKFFDIESKGNEIYLRSKSVFSNFSDFISGEYRITIDSNHVGQNIFTRPNLDSSTPSLPSQNPLEPEILYANQINKEDMTITIVGKNLSSVEKKDIVVKNAKNESISFDIIVRNDLEIKISFPQNLSNGSYLIQIGKTSTSFNYQKVNEEVVVPPSLEEPDNTPSNPNPEPSPNPDNNNNNNNNNNNDNIIEPIVPTTPTISTIKWQSKLNKILVEISGQNLNLVTSFKLSILNSNDFVNLIPTFKESNMIKLEYGKADLSSNTYQLELFTSNNQVIKYSTYNYLKPTLSSYEIISSDQIKISGQNLGVLEKNEIKLEHTLEIDFEIISSSSTTITLKLKQSLTPNNKYKVSIISSNFLEFQYSDVSISSLKMSKVENNVILEITGKNLDNLSNDLIKDINEKDTKKYSLELHNTTTGEFLKLYNHANITKYNFVDQNKCQIEINNPKIGSGNFVVKLLYQNNIINTTSQFRWDIPYSLSLLTSDPKRLPAYVGNGWTRKGQIFCWFEQPVKNGFSIEKYFDVHIQDSQNFGEQLIYEGAKNQVQLVYSNFNYWNCYFQLKGLNVNFKNNWSKKIIKIYFNKKLFYSGYISHYF